MEIILPYCKYCKGNSIVQKRSLGFFGNCHNCGRVGQIIKYGDVSKFLEDNVNKDMLQSIYDMLGLHFYSIISSVNNYGIVFKQGGKKNQLLYSDFRWAKPGTGNNKISEFIGYPVVPSAVYSIPEAYKLLSHFYTGEFSEITKKKKSINKDRKQNTLNSNIQKSILSIVWKVFSIDCKPLLDMIAGKNVESEYDEQINELLDAGIDSEMLKHIGMDTKLDYNVIKPIVEYGFKKGYDTRMGAGGLLGRKVYNINDETISRLLS